MNSLGRVRRGSTVLVPGPFAADSFKVTVVEGVRVYPEEIRQPADANWAEVLKKKPNLFDGEVWSCLSYEAKREELHICVQQSSYKFVLHTHFSEAALQLPQAARCNACGLMALTETSDGFLVFGQRSQKLGQMPGYWHCVPAGNVDSPNFFGVLEKELLEETGIGWDLVGESRLLALLDSGAEQGHKFEFTFSLRLRATAEEVYKRYKTAEDGYEHDALVFVNAACAVPEDVPRQIPTVELEAFLREDGGYQLTDVSRRGVLLYMESRAAPACK